MLGFGAQPRTSSVLTLLVSTPQPLTQVMGRQTAAPPLRGSEARALRHSQAEWELYLTLWCLRQVSMATGNSAILLPHHTLFLDGTFLPTHFPLGKTT